MNRSMDEEIKRLFVLFFDGMPHLVELFDTSRDDADFRVTCIVETDSAGKYVLKLADNDFTFPEKITVWQRTVEEYRSLGYYCPKILTDRSGHFPVVEFQGRKCVAYAEEFAPFRSAENRFAEDKEQNTALYDCYKQDIWRMTARIAAKHLDYTDYPSAYCLFETFCPSDKTDEVLENALNWKAYADTLPGDFREQTERIWRMWTDNRKQLETVYKKLPTSVFQADLNPSNILLDEENRFAGVYDFNLCGKDVFLNYLIREEYSLSRICEALRIASEYYPFSELEKNTALPLYRCLTPLWYSRVEDLKKTGNDGKAIKAFLDETEQMLTAPIDFRKYME